MENIFIRPPPSEDFVYYSIYFPFANSEDKNQAIIFLKETSALIISELHQFLNVYIWQKDAFNLRIDEWFIVFLLKHTSVKFPDAVISVADNDGEFLLIESAQYLPSWLNPDNSENRVFIYQNNLHIIPLHQTSAADSLHIPTGELALVKAIQIIRNDSINTEANDKIQQSAFNRIFEYPEKIKQNFHHTKCHIPRKIAHLLYYNPQLVAPAVEAFYTRDLVSLKACQKMENFPPRSSMTVIVKFTKTLYAQLINQRFHPPKIFIQPPINSEKYKAFDLGMKLACGFEILFRNKNLFLKDKGLNKYSFNSDPEWIFFHDKLSKYGYFHNELPGSKLYTQLENVAKEQFLKNKVEMLNDDHIGNELLPLEQMDEILKKPLTSDDLLLKNNNTEDDDSCYPDQLSSQSKSELVNSYNEPNIYSKKNDLHSFKAQEGLPGPGGTIFGKLGSDKSAPHINL
ncbi:8897_t:CDS:10 [Entrophospora sp. SA101]|nr:8897_t:CDS:10 [Entrophospora sp. SA101]